VPDFGASIQEVPMRVAIPPTASVRPEGDDLVDLDVPAAVVCARCGEADCPGCAHDETQSGVVAVVPWERPGAASVVRLWATARATTLDAERFFEWLPDGPVAPALRFAIVSEVLAATAMALVAIVAVLLVAPGWVVHVALYQSTTAFRFAGIGVPFIAFLLVAAHAAHGWALARGARRCGARGAGRRALRFGLYAAGWDLVIGPIGAVVLLVRGGPAGILSIGSVAIGLPGRSARAFLRGCYRLEGPRARPALRASYAVAIVVTLVGAVAAVAALAAAWEL
jgi:hypothetical protein